MNGSATSMATNIARIFGTKIERHFLDLGERLEQRDGDADHEPDQHQRGRDDHAA